MPETTISPRRPRLRRSDCSGPGVRRRRRGRGFLYTDPRGERIADEEVLERVRALAIPPAWKDVWICSDPWGHLQATGIDAAGRKQYLYHTRWRQRRDQEKFQRMERFARSLPKLRRALASDLQGANPTREAVLACAVRLLDVGLFRVGSEEYADEEHGIGLATVRRDHVRLRGEAIVFDYPGKGGVRRVHQIEDPLSGDLVRALRRRRGGPPELLAYRQGRQWSGLRSGDINEYLKRHLGEEFSAKDFRTWNATVLAAVSVAADAPQAATKTARKRAVNRAVRGVSEMLGNTPAVARRSYIDPRVFDRYLSGWTIAGALGALDDIDIADNRDRARLERAVLDLLDEEEASAALQRATAAETT
ncbi:MAG: DNA topoisomerase IB [Actinomycetota bacterium]|nr:DNA topoisomerase IB [Actinomycetota bacterium]